MSRLYFPLRSSVEFFEEPAGATPVTRAKEGAVLFEEVLFEDGQFMATVGDNMNWTMHRPRHELSEVDLEEARPPAGPGEKMMIAIGTETAPGVPAEKMQSIGETVVEQIYTAQWHSAAIDELQALDVPWAGIATPSDETLQRLASPIAEAGREFANRVYETSLSTSQIDFASKALARDAVFAATLGASINVSSMFGPMIEGVSQTPGATGAEALAFMVPNLESLSWEAIAEFRDRPGSVEARGLLREVEEKAAAQEPGDAQDHLDKVRAAIADSLAAALLETEASVSKVAAREAVNLAVSLVPVVGSFVGPAAGIAEVLGEQAEQRASGIFALVKLRFAGSQRPSQARIHPS